MIPVKWQILTLTAAISHVYCKNTTEIVQPKLESIEPKQSSRFKFQDDSIDDDERQGYGLVKFEDQNPDRPFHFQDNINTEQTSVENFNNGLNNQGVGVKFQDDNSLQLNTAGQKKKRRKRRRRRPKQALGLAPGFRPYAQQRPNLAFGSRPFYRPARRPSMAESTLSSVTDALGSIARYDDLKCVPRMLCEVAGGSGASGGTGTAGGSGAAAGGLGAGALQAVGSLQPLITLLAAYNGVSSSPLFVFGRAVLLGVTSRGNTGSCRYAYSQCPTDPDQLVEYLNNHNGGFFRFFNTPQNQGQQNLEQFYNQLSSFPTPGQFQNGVAGGAGNYGLLNQTPQLPLQNYGILNQNVNRYPHNYGPLNQNVYPYPQNYPPPGLLSVPGQQSYGFGYPYGQSINYKNDKIKIQKRIQNNPVSTYNYIDTEHAHNDKVKWLFPANNDDVYVEDVRREKGFVFPEDSDHKNKYVTSNSFSLNKDNNRRAKGFNFPEKQSNRSPAEFEDNGEVHSPSIFAKEENLFDTNNYEGQHLNFGYTESQDEGVQVVYVLRGDTDPHNPEIVRLRPGQQTYVQLIR